MLKGLGDVGQIMKLQKELKNMQKKLQKTENQGANRDGTIKARVNGEYKLIGIEIDESLVKSGEVGKLEQQIVEAVNDAVNRTKEHSAREMGKLTGGINIPGLGNFLK